MKFFCDANISPHLAKALNSLSLPENHLVQHLREKFDPRTPDITWIRALADEGGWAVITRDRAMSRQPVEQEVLRRSGLTVFMLAKAWGSQDHWSMSAALVRWWPKIIEQACLIEGGAAFEVPFGFTGRKRLKQIKL